MEYLLLKLLACCSLTVLIFLTPTIGSEVNLQVIQAKTLVFPATTPQKEGLVLCCSSPHIKRDKSVFWCCGSTVRLMWYSVFCAWQSLLSDTRTRLSKPPPAGERPHAQTKTYTCRDVRKCGKINPQIIFLWEQLLSAPPSSKLTALPETLWEFFQLQSHDLTVIKVGTCMIADALWQLRNNYFVVINSKGFQI